GRPQHAEPGWKGAPLPASILETEILPARLGAYDPADLDTVIAAGEVIWVGLEPLGERDGRVALYLADHWPRLRSPAGIGAAETKDLSDRESAILSTLSARGASFFGALHEAVGAGYPGETVDGLWNLAWRGLVTNDTLHPLRAFTRSRATSRRRARQAPGPAFRSRRLAPPSAEGRWSLVPASADVEDSPSRSPLSLRRRTAAHTTWATALSQQLLARHGVLTREAVAAEAIAGGFGAVYPVLKALEEAGRLRRGYFVAGLGATQFALPGALDLLRSLRDSPDDPEVVELAATDPANPYGTILKWPAGAARAASARQTTVGATTHADGLDPSAGSTGRGPTRTVGATVVLVDGALVAYLARGDRQLTTWLPETDPQRGRAARAVARVLADRSRRGGDAPRGMLIEEIDGVPAQHHPLARTLVEDGFVAGALGLQATLRRL
ncbi:MAG: DEAD/DEAH box helicase, partial [Betaproteobacteria bacterium]